MKAFTCLLLLLIFVYFLVQSNQTVFIEEDDIIFNINNNKPNLWIAGSNEKFKNLSKEEIIDKLAFQTNINRMSSLKNEKRSKIYANESEIPTSYDLRTKYPECSSISEIKDESTCNASWAVATTSTITDRICIQLKDNKTRLSAEELITCCKQCGNCKGGNSQTAYFYYNTKGIVSGGEYNSKDFCKSYSFEPCLHFNSEENSDSLELAKCGATSATPECSNTCTGNTSIKYEKNKYFGSEPEYFTNEREIQEEIIKNGPVSTRFILFKDFLYYKSGVYSWKYGFPQLGLHNLKIIGWGEDINEDKEKIKYWICVNSWNNNWGENGYVRFLRGVDHLEIESNAMASNPIKKENRQFLS